MTETWVKVGAFMGLLSLAGLILGVVFMGAARVTTATR